MGYSPPPEFMKVRKNVMKKVYWSVKMAVIGSLFPVHFYFQKKENADKFSELDYCDPPKKHVVNPETYSKIIFED